MISQYYSDVDGPYLLGNKITYADFAVYQSIDNDKRIGTAPVSGSAFIRSLNLLLTIFALVDPAVSSRKVS